MSYPVNSPITYTAAPQTVGYLAGDHSVAWTFDDGTTASTASTAKNWTTTGDHLATAVATNTITGVTGEASKLVAITDYATMSFVSTGVSVKVAASANMVQITSAGNTLIFGGGKVLNWNDYYNPASAVVVDTTTLAMTEFTWSSLTSGHLTFVVAAVKLTAGPRAGKILIHGHNTTAYGFLNLSDMSYTPASNTSSYALSTSNISTNQVPSCVLSTGKILFLGSTSAGGSKAYMLYDQAADTWTTAATGTVPLAQDEVYPLAGGKAICIKDNQTATYIYDSILNSWSSGPTLPKSVGNGKIVCQDENGRIYQVGLTAVYSWGLGEGAFTSMVAFPVTSMGGTGNNTYCELIASGDGILAVAGGNSAGPTYTQTGVYHINTNLFIVGGTNGGTAYRVGYGDGYFWKCSAAGTLYRMANQ